MDAKLQIEINGSKVGVGKMAWLSKPQNTDIRGLIINRYLPDPARQALGGFAIVLGIGSGNSRVGAALPRSSLQMVCNPQN